MSTKIEYSLVRSDRKTWAVRILRDGSVEVRAPMRLPVWRIEALLEEKREWIETHRQEMLARYAAVPDARQILFLGKEYPVLTRKTRDLACIEEQFFAPEGWTDAEIRSAMPALYKKLAKAYIVPRTQEMAFSMGLSPERIGITSARTRWGSCSDRRNLHFSWRLMAAPPEAVEYVICHELAHMWEMNHSSRFWARVAERMPDWRTRRQMLASVQTWLDMYFE